LNALSLALFGAAAVAFSRQRRLVLAVCGALFVPVAAAAALAVWWPVSPAVCVVLLASTLGVSVLLLLLYALDHAFAVFALEMTYPAMLCWVLWPALIFADFVGMAMSSLG
jgi:hypothetical protein